MSELLVIDELQAYLVAGGVGQLPSAEPSLTVPSIWTLPRQGAAMPRSGDGEFLERQTVTLNDLSLNGPPGLESWMEDTFVDVIVRSQNPAEGKLLLRSIAGLLHPIGSPQIGKRNWTMHNLHVLYSSIFRREQALPQVENGLTYDRKATFRFTCARSDLAA